MGEFEIFVITTNLVILVFIVGIIAFLVRYRERKRMHQSEKAAINEQHLKHIFFTRLEIQQQTMQDIGREIHDNVNQKLTLASLYCYQLETAAAQNNTTERIATIGSILNEAIADLRSLSRSLAEREEDDISILDLVEKECKRVSTLSAPVVTWSANVAHIAVPLSLRNYLHRIIQEFLQNSIRHSVCRNIFIDFEMKETGLGVTLRDDGCGFDVAQVLAGPGIGLANMRKRSKLLGIELDIQSVVGQGTQVTIFIPADKLKTITDEI